MKIFLKCVLAILMGISLNIGFANTTVQGKALIESQLFVPASAIKQSFRASKTLEGYVVKPRHLSAHIVFFDTKSHYLILGTVITPAGVNLTKQATLNYIIQPTQLPQMLSDAEHTAWFQQGKSNAPHTIYVLADPNCSACHEFYENLLPYIKEGQLRVRWILYPFLKASSYAKASSILMAKDPTKAFEENENIFDTVLEEGGINAVNKVPNHINRLLRKNLKFGHYYKVTSTPTTLYLNKAGAFQVLKGSLPKSAIASWVNSIY